ncbi:hypothetical protein BG842_17730 [Haladaptatus sp. W1]|nr:hypothetical protein BG842_17730 [Haladaptatus sp. W1]
MNIRVNNNTRTGGQIVAPDDPVPPVDLEEYFSVVTFETTKTEAPPFSEVKVSWAIESKDDKTQFEDFEFRLNGPPLFTLDEIPADGEHSFTIHYTTFLQLQGRQSGSPWMPLGPRLTVSIDDTECQVVGWDNRTVDAIVYTELKKFISDIAELRLRGKSEPSSDWNADRIRYYFPLELVTPEFPNADMDVWMDVEFQLVHDKDGVDIELVLDFETNVIYSMNEIMITGGIAAKVASLVEDIMPMVLECPKRQIQNRFKNDLIDVPAVKNGLKTGEFYDIRIVTQGRGWIEILICKPPTEPGDSSEEVVT